MGQCTLEVAHGVTFFNPDTIWSNPFQVKAYFTMLNIYNEQASPAQKINKQVILLRDINWQEEITLNHQNTSFALYFAANHYANPSSIRYRYRLLGLHDGWTELESGHRSVSYTNLDPGSYDFELQATYGDNPWSHYKTKLSIQIVPPFWLTLAFKGLVILLVLCLFIVFHIWRTSNIKRQKRLLQAEISRQTHELSLANTVLIDQQEKLKQVDAVKTRFFTYISHELKTPLTLILTPITSLLSKTKSIRESEYLNIAKNNADRLLTLVNQLLDVSKAEDGAIKLTVTKCDLNVTLSSLAQSFEITAAERGIDFVYLGHEKKMEGYFDTDRIEKICSNLLLNALKYVNVQGEIRFSVEQESHNSGETFVKLIVSNTGHQMKSEDLEKIFDYYYQVTSGRFSSDGSGIGLALVKHLVALHKGRIEVQSEVRPNQEIALTWFTVLIPCSKRAYNGLEVPLEKEATLDVFIEEGEEKCTVNLGQNNTHSDEKLPMLLIIEDNMELASLLINELENVFEIVCVYDGESGIEQALANIPDIILSDVMLPRVGGLELCKELKAHEKTSHIPVVLLTAKTTDEEQLHGYEVGADDYVTKPFNMNILTSKLKNLAVQNRLLKKRYGNDLDALSMELSNTEESLLIRLNEEIKAELDNPSLDANILSNKLGISRSLLYNKLKQATGQSVNEYLLTYRLNVAAKLLAETDLGVGEVQYKIGILSKAYFSKSFKSLYQVPPSMFKKNLK